ncbi:MAG: hypothetical protein GY798_25065 [Hyphomicrobiales bacterium]|nr:hypothetical protein [Hyphomicrobiales bacterium]
MIKPDIDVRLSDYRDLLGQVRDALIAWVAEDPPTRRARLGQSLARIREAKAMIRTGTAE